MAMINVLMCGGRRTGKTSILAAIQENIMQMFPQGDIVLDMPKGGRLVNYRAETTKIFGYDYEEESTYLANQGAMGDKYDYECSVYLQRKASNMQLNFTDVPGEWFIKEVHRKELEQKLEGSQILIIAVDSPHLMETQGRYHEVFNRASIITEQIKKTFSGNKEPRMVLFVPVKCERYRATQDHVKNRMPDLEKCVEKSYHELIEFLTTGKNKGIYTVAVTPCFTMGGLEYLRFVPPMDEDGKPQKGMDGGLLPDIERDSEGCMVMNYLTEYLLLTDDCGDHYYKPENCEQPLLYVLLYLIAISRKMTSKFFSNIWAAFQKRPNRKVLESCKATLLSKIRREEEDGFAILNDPLEMLEKD